MYCGDALLAGGDLLLEEEIEEIMFELCKPFTEGMKDEEMESIPKSAKKGGGDSLAVAPLLDETDAEETLLLKLFCQIESTCDNT